MITEIIIKNKIIEGLFILILKNRNKKIVEKKILKKKLNNLISLAYNRH